MSTLRRHDLFFLFQVLYFFFYCRDTRSRMFQVQYQVVNNLCSTPFLFLSATCSSVRAMRSLVSLPYAVTLGLASPYA